MEKYNSRYANSQFSDLNVIVNISTSIFMQFGLLLVYIYIYIIYTVFACCCPVSSAVGSPTAAWLHNQAVIRLKEGFPPHTRATNIAAFRQFLAFIIVMRLELPCSLQAIITYLEFLVQNGLRATSLRNHNSILKHFFFALFEWLTYVFNTRKVLLFIKSVQNNENK